MSDEVGEIEVYRESDLKKALEKFARDISERKIIPKAIGVVQRGGDWHSLQGSCTTSCNGKYIDPITGMSIDYVSAGWGNGGHLNIIYDGKPVFLSRQNITPENDRPYLDGLIIDRVVYGSWVVVLDELPRQRLSRTTPHDSDLVVSRVKILELEERFGKIFG